MDIHWAQFWVENTVLVQNIHIICANFIFFYFFFPFHLLNDLTERYIQLLSVCSCETSLETISIFNIQITLHNIYN